MKKYLTIDYFYVFIYIMYIITCLIITIILKKDIKIIDCTLIIIGYMIFKDYCFKE
jgi:hypothetical protein